MPVRASAPIDRPWKAVVVETRCVRPVRRVALNAASFASVPELVRKTRAPSGEPVSSSASLHAKATWGFEAKKLLMCPKVPSWAVIAALT